MLRKFLRTALFSLLVLLGVSANAAISFVGAGTPNGGTGTSNNVAYPAVTINADDIIIIHCFSSGLTSCTVSGGGYASLGELEATGGLTANQEILWKRAAGGETGTVTVSQSGASLKWYVILVYRGVVAAPTTPYEGLATATLNDATTATPDIVTTGTDRLVVMLTSKDTLATTPSQPSTWTDRANTSTTTSTDGTIHDFEKAAPTATTVTGPDVDYSPNTGSWFAHGFALIAASGGGGGGGSALLLRRRRQ